MAEKFSGRPGEYFTLEQTLNGIEAILTGKPLPDKAAKPAPDASKATSAPEAPSKQSVDDGGKDAAKQSAGTSASKKPAKS